LPSRLGAPLPFPGEKKARLGLGGWGGSSRSTVWTATGTAGGRARGRDTLTRFPGHLDARIVCGSRAGRLRCSGGWRVVDLKCARVTRGCHVLHMYSHAAEQLYFLDLLELHCIHKY
jgi:hypothetical protein